MAEVEAALSRIEPQIGGADFELFKRMVGTLLFVMGLLRAQRTTIARLRRFFGFPSSEKTATVLGGDEKSDAAPSDGTSGEPPAAADPCAPGGSDPGAAPGADPKRPKQKGHGRVPASEYEAATHFPVTHESLTSGGACPGCARGKLYDLKEPARLLRIVGQPVLCALCWDCQRLRCSACGEVYTARAPKEAQGPKFDESAVSMLALCRYSAGLPHNRLERLQRNLQTPVPSSTQWDVINDNAPTFQPIFDEMAKRAAQGEVVHDDDTYVRILEFMGKRRAELLKNGDLADPERTGLFTTAILSVTHDGPIALFYTGRKYAGENLADLLNVRDAEREPPILMSDALDSRNVPKGHTVVESNCTAHARRGIVDQIVNFPAECKYVLEMLRKVFVIDARCKQQGLSPQERLRVHQRDSSPVMVELHEWMSAQFTDKRVEPNSGLGKAYWYMLKRWHKLTLFLRRAGAPIDNNICERALKKAICHRRNSLFYRSQRGAHVGDMFMSLIHTAELRGANPFDFLTQVQRHQRAAAANPADWLPWTYRDTLARVAASETGSRAPPPGHAPPRPPLEQAPTSSPPSL
jgi:transposase